MKFQEIQRGPEPNLWQVYSATTSPARRRLVRVIQRLKPDLVAAKAAGLGEAETLNLVARILERLFGYSRKSGYLVAAGADIGFSGWIVSTSRGPVFPIVVCPVGTEIKWAQAQSGESFARRNGLKWVGATDAVIWKLYWIEPESMGQYREPELWFNLIDYNPKFDKQMTEAAFLTRESWEEDRLPRWKAISGTVGIMLILSQVAAYVLIPGYGRGDSLIWSGLLLIYFCVIGVLSWRLNRSQESSFGPIRGE